MESTRYLWPRSLACGLRPELVGLRIRRGKNVARFRAESHIVEVGSACGGRKTGVAHQGSYLRRKWSENML